ncbi:hypothetical protein [Xylanimonas oleitrophica]|uniref:hypothetical protein n=1 Tax=Xylanimonas oleitrophica TaxID=2607479 RepID=UPI001FEC285C|nr:hypothetical protein [Xylanimonas oleitrophica]
MDRLRTGITEQCLSLADARAVADGVLDELELEPFPTTSIVDEAAYCSRLDVMIGGNAQVTVYGPRAAKG